MNHSVVSGALSAHLEVNVVVLQLALGHQGSLQRAKLGALGDASLGEHAAHEAVHVEQQGQAGPGLGHDRAVGERVEGPVLRTRRRVGAVALLTPWERE